MVFNLHALAIILPTVWEYVVDHFGAQQWLYSLAISSTNLVEVFFGPVFGAVYDRTHATKLLIMISIASSAVGEEKCSLPV